MLNNLFTIILPDDWSESTVYTFDGPLDSGIKHNLVMMIDREVGKKLDLKAYVLGRIEDLKQTMPGFELFSETPKEISESPAIVIVYKYIPSNNLILFQKQYYIHKENKVYFFTSTFSKKTLQTIGPIIDQMVESLDLLDEKEAEDHFYK